MFTRRKKFGNVKSIYKGIKFDSRKECERFIELETLEKVGMISELERQKRYLLQASFIYRGKKIQPITYIADFVYKQDGKIFVEDVKGGEATKTPLYEVKKKMLLKLHGHEIIFLEI